MTFKEYLAQRRKRRTPTGDFVNDAIHDDDFPDVQSWGEVRRYLEAIPGYTVPPHVIALGYKVWRSYRRSLRRREAA